MSLRNTDLFVAYRPVDQKHYKVPFSTIGASYLPIAGGTLTGDLGLSGSKKITITKLDGTNQFQLRPNVGSAPYEAGDYASNFYMFNGGELRFRSTLTDSTSPYSTHAIFGPKDHKIGDTDYTQATKLYFVVTPTAEHHAANKYYVDNTVETYVDNNVNSLPDGTQAGQYLMWNGTSWVPVSNIDGGTY